VRDRSFIVVASMLALLVVGAAGLYLYDHGRRDVIARGVKIGGVSVGGMRASAARRKVEHALTARLAQPIVVAYGHRRFQLSPHTARAGFDVKSTIADAVNRSRQGDIFTRTLHALQGHRVNADLPPQVSFSRRAVKRFVAHVTAAIDRAPRDATVTYSASGLGKVPGREGAKVNAVQLRNGVLFDLENQRFEGVLRPVVSRVRPKVTMADLADRYPRVIVVDRNSYALKLYSHLRLSKTYGIAVGQVGLETPAGLYDVTDKSVDPSWSVPNEAWAGSLAGQVIPGGAPNNPIKSRWIGFFPGDGIHGTADDSSIGSAASHGCIRMHVSDVQDLYDQVAVGDPVYII